jgi:hypothetical protein
MAQSVAQVTEFDCLLGQEFTRCLHALAHTTSHVRGLKLTAHLHLVFRSCGLHLHSPYIFIVCA